MNQVNQFTTGLRRHPYRFVVEAGLVFGALWTLVDAISQAFPALAFDSPNDLAGLATVSALAGLWRALPLSDVSFRLGSTNTTLRVRFGDLFESSGLRVIPVNEFFDSLLGAHVSSASLHGKIISRVFGGDSSMFDREVDPQLTAIPSEIISRPGGKQKRFPLGTTAVVRAGNDRYLLFALSHTDILTNKAHASVPDLWNALAGLWDGARVESHGCALILPLVGSGQSGVGLPPQHLMHLLILSLVAETKRRRVAGEIVIVLEERCFEDVDISTIAALVR